MPSLTQTKISVPKLPSRANSGVPRSQVERLWMISGGLIAFILVLISYFFFISPQRSNTATVRGKVAAAQKQNAVLQAHIDALNEQNKDIAKYQAELAQARLALPSTSGIPDFLRSLQSLGNATQTQVTALSVAPPTIVTAQAGAQAAAQAAAPTSTTEPATPSPTTPAPGAVPGAVAAQLYALPINATVTGSSTALIAFLDQLQAVQPRAVLITQITEGAAQSATGPSSHDMSLQLTMDAFVSPSSSVENASLSAAAATN
jgi:type IV pilus assembly protein PilO